MSREREEYEKMKQQEKSKNNRNTLMKVGAVVLTIVGIFLGKPNKES